MELGIKFSIYKPIKSTNQKVTREFREQELINRFPEYAVDKIEYEYASYNVINDSFIDLDYNDYNVIGTTLIDGNYWTKMQSKVDNRIISIFYEDNDTILQQYKMILAERVDYILMDYNPTSTLNPELYNNIISHFIFTKESLLDYYSKYCNNKKLIDEYSIRFKNNILDKFDDNNMFIYISRS